MRGWDKIENVHAVHVVLHGGQQTLPALEYNQNILSMNEKERKVMWCYVMWKSSSI